MLRAVLRLALPAALPVFAAPASSVGFSEVNSPNASDLVPRKYPNCKSLNRRYLHGVARLGARDRTKSGDPVTNFKRSNVLYRLKGFSTVTRTTSPARSNE
jgi:hypothetical protein